MKKQQLFILLIVIAMISCKKPMEEITANFPFPQHSEYKGTYLSPSNYSQKELDNHTTKFYDNWKQKYLKNNCSDDQYYVDYDEGNTINVSEGLGYGMMITVIMAGYDTEAKIYFDGMFRFFKAHPSSINENLMAWEQIEGCITNPDGGNDAASDGDIDIAYALLLADKQWGSSGEINYISEAKNLMNAIMQDEINQETWTVKLGDWSTSNDPNFYYSTRPSDFITDHFRAFNVINPNANWDKVINTCYNLIENMQTNYSETTGLIPDFIINTNTSAMPANAQFLESDYDGNYYYNSCRVPWRITTDYLISGDTRAKNALDKINNWIISDTKGNVENISAGYLLTGTAIADYNDLVFSGAFAVSATTSNNQTWLNNLYNQMVNQSISDNGYYGNTLKMLYMITISKNYWTIN